MFYNISFLIEGMFDERSGRGDAGKDFILLFLYL